MSILGKYICLFHMKRLLLGNGIFPSMAIETLLTLKHVLQIFIA